VCQYASAHRGETFTTALKRKYQEENEKTTAYEELFTTLQNCPEKDAVSMFSLVRQGVDPRYLLRKMKNCDLLMQLSVVPETRRRYQFPYLPSMPIRLQTPDNPYLKSMLYETAFLETDKGSDENSDPSLEDTQLSQYQNIYLQRYRAAEVLDPLIDHIKPSKWTTVITDDHLMRTLLQAYVLHEYPTFPVFHKDIFFQAMINNDKRFCSSMLVNALLAEACVSVHNQLYSFRPRLGRQRAGELTKLQHCHMGIPNREQFWVPKSLRYRFLAEATRLWELENDKVDLVTVQAAALLNLVYSHNSMDKIGQVYLMHSLKKAQQLELFGDQAAEDDERMIHARVFTAWALFNWQWYVDPAHITPSRYPSSLPLIR
jgi:hypothetical protein